MAKYEERGERRMKKRYFVLVGLICLMFISMIDPALSRRQAPYPKESNDGASIQLGYEHLSLEGIDPYTQEEIPLFLILRENTEVDNPTVEMLIDTQDMSDIAKSTFEIRVMYFDYWVNETSNEKIKLNQTLDDSLSKIYKLDSIERSQTIVLNLKHNLKGTWVEIKHQNISWIFYHKTASYLIEADINVSELNRIKLKLIIISIAAIILAYLIVNRLSERSVYFDFDFSKFVTFMSLGLVILMLVLPPLDFDDFLIKYFSNDFTYDWYVLLTILIIMLPLGLKLANQSLEYTLLTADRLIANEIKENANAMVKFRDRFKLGRTPKLRLRSTREGLTYVPKGFIQSIVRVLYGPPQILWGKFNDQGEFINDLDGPLWHKTVVWPDSKRGLFSKEIPAVAWRMEKPSLNLSMRWWILIAIWMYVYFLLKNDVFAIFEGFTRSIIEIIVFVFVVILLPFYSVVNWQGQVTAGQIEIQPEPKTVTTQKAQAMRQLTTLEDVATLLEDLSIDYESLIASMKVDSLITAEKMVTPMLDALNQLLGLDNMEETTEDPKDETRNDTSNTGDS